MKNYYYLFFAILFIYYQSTLTAQTTDSLKAKISESYEDQVEASGDIGEDSDLIETVELLSENQINLNSATISELQIIPNVDPVIAQKIVEFRIENSGFKSLSDLQKIPEISIELYRLMLPFVKITLNRTENNDNKKKSNDQTNQKKELMPLLIQLRQRSAFDFQDKKAFVEKKYNGNKYKIYNRLKSSYQNYSAGIIVEKDPGESNYADYLNSYFQIKDITLPADFQIKKIILGSFQASYGQGLIQWTNSGFGKSTSTILSPKRNERGIQPYLSSNENQYFSGIAFSIFNTLSSSSFDIFYSQKKYDGKITPMEIYDQNLNNDDIISYSLDNSGYHRDSTETVKKDQIKLSTIGINLTHQFDNLGSVGITAVSSKIYNNPIFEYVPQNGSKTEIEDYYNVQQRKNISYSFDFDFTVNSISFYGEAAIHNKTAFGISSGLIFKPAKQISYTIHLRKFDSGFLPLSGKPFSEKTSTPANESGIYHGLEFKSGKLKLNLYYDTYQFPWSTFQNIYPRYGYDWLIFFEYDINKYSTLYFQYKNEKVMESYTSTDVFNRDVKLTSEVQLQNIKLQLTDKLTDQFNLKSRIDYTFYTGISNITTSGFALVEQIKYTINSSANLIFQYHYFDSPEYNNRIYIFENDLPGLLTSVSLYGKGTRLSISSTVDIISSLSFSAKFAITKYSDRKVISSGDSEISGNLLTQMGVQLDWNF